MFAPFQYVRPQSMDDALKAMAAGGSVALGGGSDLLTCLREHILAPERLVSLADLAQDLDGVRQQGRGFIVGAATTLTTLAEDPLITSRVPGLAQAASAVGSPQLRNQGTVAGNLCQKARCWYYRGEFDCIRKGGPVCYAVGGENQFHCLFGGVECYIVHPSDTAPMWLALDARVHAQSDRGKLAIPIDDFFVLPEDDPTRETVLEPDELITAVEVRELPPKLHTSYRKVRARRAWDFALAGLALALVVENGTVRQGRAVLSGVAPVPWRSRALEEAIMGKRLTPEVIEQAAEAALAEAQPMDQNAYKIPLAKGMIREELAKVAAA